MASQSRDLSDDFDQTASLSLRSQQTRVHEYDMSIEHNLPTPTPRTSPELSPLSNLPRELREIIYNYIFHDHTSNHDCRKLYVRKNDLGCRCAQGLSQTNHFFYKETRVRYYQHGRFVFDCPQYCQQFLNNIQIAKYIGHLSVAYRDCWGEGSMLRPIFDILINSTSLRSLEIQCNEVSYQIREPGPPLYMQKSRPGRHFAAQMYDISLRPIKHPLGTLSDLRKLVVFGKPEPEIEEALVQLTFKIDALAKGEGKDTHTKEGYEDSLSQWVYEKRIVEDILLHEKQTDGSLCLSKVSLPKMSYR